MPIRESGVMLTKRQKEFVDYLDGHITKHGYAPTLEEIGEDLSVTRERVRQIEAGALAKANPAVRNLEADAAPELDKLRRVRQLLVRLFRRKRIPAEGQQVLHAEGAEASEDLAKLEARMRDAGEVRHRRQVRPLDQVQDDACRALAGHAATPVRDRYEGRMERLEVRDRPREQPLLVIVLRREELERERSSRGQKIGDAVHATEFSGGRCAR